MLNNFKVTHITGDKFNITLDQKSRHDILYMLSEAVKQFTSMICDLDNTITKFDIELSCDIIKTYSNIRLNTQNMYEVNVYDLTLIVNAINNYTHFVQCEYNEKMRLRDIATHINSMMDKYFEV